MHNYKLTIQYDGSGYKGWQRLGKGENTIQEMLEQVLTKMLGYRTEITGCSRTDAGVHALAQTANFKTKEAICESYIKEYMNKNLPEDICVLEVSSVPLNFHARYSVKDKTYLYKIWNKDYHNPFMRKYSMYVGEQLNINAMKNAGTYFIGVHDFTAFSNAKAGNRSMVREIYELNLQEDKGFVYIRIRGNGFLYNMVRWIAGTLIDVGLGKINANDIPGIIKAKERNRTGNLAIADGLYLEKVTY